MSSNEELKGLLEPYVELYEFPEDPSVEAVSREDALRLLRQVNDKSHYTQTISLLRRVSDHFAMTDAPLGLDAAKLLIEMENRDAE